MSLKPFPYQAPALPQARVSVSPDREIAWIDMRYEGLPCFSRKLVDSLVAVPGQLPLDTDGKPLPRYAVLHSSTYDRTFGIGGDLEHFLNCIHTGDRASLEDYAGACVDLLEVNRVTDLMTIALVNGDCLGGAFETALSCDFIIAERGAKFGFPEIMFGMFPGMGGLSFLSRRINPGRARRMVQEARTYLAEELYELGIVDMLAEPGQGITAVQRFVRQNSSRNTGMQGIARLMNTLYPVSRNELEENTRAWVDVAFRLSDSNLSLMRRLVKSQKARWTPQALEKPCARTTAPSAC